MAGGARHGAPARRRAGSPSSSTSSRPAATRSSTCRCRRSAASVRQGDRAGARRRRGRPRSASMKDVPPSSSSLEISAKVGAREVPWDAVLRARRPDWDGPDHARAALAHGARVGTSSMRRQCQLLARRPDLNIAMLRGNVPTRIRKLDDGEFDAVILAAAGLMRLGLGERITQMHTADRGVDPGGVAGRARHRDAHRRRRRSRAPRPDDAQAQKNGRAGVPATRRAGLPGAARRARNRHVRRPLHRQHVQHPATARCCARQIDDASEAASLGVQLADDLLTRRGRRGDPGGDKALIPSAIDERLRGHAGAPRLLVELPHGTTIGR